MKTTELLPTKSNILSTINENILNRNDQVYFFASILNAIEGPYTIALNAKWGEGKTFFVKQVKALIDCCNPFNTEYDESEADNIIQAISNSIGEDNRLKSFMPQMTVYYDAWICDNDNDPICSLIYEIIRETGTCYNIKKDASFSDLLKVGASIADGLVNRNITGIINSIDDLRKANDPLEEIKGQKSLQEKVAEFFKMLPIEKGNRLVIFVDELDRCKPDFAVRFLERIKHYFSNEKVTFVFSINKAELCHTINCFYGEEFDSSKYLTRFFDYVIDLPQGNYERYQQKIGLHNSIHVFDNIQITTAKHFQFSLRDLAKYVEECKVAASKPAYQISYISRGIQWAWLTFVPIMIGIRIHSSRMYEAFIAGKDGSPFFEIMENCESEGSILKCLLNRGEVYGEGEDAKIIKRREKLEEVYNTVFVDSDKESFRDKMIGEVEFSKSTKDQILKVISSLSLHASVE